MLTSSHVIPVSGLYGLNLYRDLVLFIILILIQQSLP